MANIVAYTSLYGRKVALIVNRYDEFYFVLQCMVASGANAKQPAI